MTTARALPASLVAVMVKVTSETTDWMAPDSTPVVVSKARPSGSWGSMA